MEKPTKVVAKFMCSVAAQKEDQTNVTLMAVTNGSEENKAFAKSTPCGHVTLVISDDTPASGFFLY